MSLFPDCYPVIQGAPRLVVGTSRRVASAPRHFVGTPTPVVDTPSHVVSTSRLVLGAFRLVTSAPKHVASPPRCFQVQQKFLPALQDVPKLITITSMVLLYQSPEIPVTPQAGWNSLLGSYTLLKLPHLSLHSSCSQTLLKASSHLNTFC
jgi:hypothetical protein